MSSAPCGKCGKPTRALRRQFYDYPAGVGGYYHRRCWFGRDAPAILSAKQEAREREPEWSPCHDGGCGRCPSCKARLADLKAKALGGDGQ